MAFSIVFKPFQSPFRVSIGGVQGLYNGSIGAVQGMWKNAGSGVWWGLVAHFTFNFNEMLAQKLCRIILFPFGLVTLRFNLGKIRQISICMIFGSSGHDQGSRNQLFSTWRHQVTTKQKYQIIFGGNIMLGNYQISGIDQIGKYVCRKIRKIRLMNS